MSNVAAFSLLQQVIILFQGIFYGLEQGFHVFLVGIIYAAAYKRQLFIITHGTVHVKNVDFLCQLLWLHDFMQTNKNILDKGRFAGLFRSENSHIRRQQVNGQIRLQLIEGRIINADLQPPYGFAPGS